MSPNRFTLSFLEFFQTFRRGELMRQANDELKRVVTAMEDTGGDGEVTIKIPLKFNKGGQIESIPKVTSKIPARPMGTGIYYLDDGHLSTRDPEQLDIEDEIERRRTMDAAE